ncbi:MAG TPA: wax ester/triacylglycerol synthase domain-containing protein, partial [Acidimicrobiales bacterium]|nr:wax ester/triacylglycerol synthase domain-containing protein [Acidimicrobiales bacterium]
MTGAEQLSGLDDAFLYVESERTPMHMATIAIFEGGPLHRPDGSLRFDDVVALVQSRMDLLPKLRRKPQRELLGQGPLVWVDDEDFDVRHHLRVMTLDPPGTDEQLMALAGEVLATPLDRAHPLWEIVLVDGLREGRVGLIERLHHSMADGVAAAELGAVLLGLEPDESPPDPPRSWVAEPHAVGEAVVQRLGVLLGAPVRLASRGVDVARHPGQAVQHASDLLRSVATLATPRTLAPRSSLNVQIGPKKEVRAVRLVFEDIHTIAQEAGATVNDVFLTLVSGGLRELLSARGELKEDTEVQVMVPVNLVSGRGGALGNRVSGLFVRIPVAVEDATDALARIAAR